MQRSHWSSLWLQTSFDLCDKEAAYDAQESVVEKDLLWILLRGIFISFLGLEYFKAAAFFHMNNLGLIQTVLLSTFEKARLSAVLAKEIVIIPFARNSLY